MSGSSLCVWEADVVVYNATSTACALARRWQRAAEWLPFGACSVPGWQCTYVGGCQNYGPFLGTQNIKGRIIIGIQKGTIILTTTHVHLKAWSFFAGGST